MLHSSNLTLLYQTSSATLLSQESLGVKANTNQGVVSAQLASSQSLATDTTSTLVSLDAGTLSAIATAVAPFYGSDASFNQSETTQLLTGLSSALSQGDGAFVVSYSVNGSPAMIGAFTPAEFGKLQDGEDRPYNDLSLGSVIQAADEAGWQVAGSAQAAALQDPRLQDELKALAILNKTSSSASPTKQAVAQLVDPSTTALTAKASVTEDGYALSISIVWVPPSDAATVQTQTTAASASAQSLTLDSLA